MIRHLTKPRWVRFRKASSWTGPLGPWWWMEGVKVSRWIQKLSWEIRNTQVRPGWVEVAAVWWMADPLIQVPHTPGGLVLPGGAWRRSRYGALWRHLDEMAELCFCLFQRNWLKPRRRTWTCTRCWTKPSWSSTTYRDVHTSSSWQRRFPASNASTLPSFKSLFLRMMEAQAQGEMFLTCRSEAAESSWDE